MSKKAGYVCDKCSKFQWTIIPWKHIPKCKFCGKPIKDELRSKRMGLGICEICGVNGGHDQNCKKTSVSAVASNNGLCREEITEAKETERKLILFALRAAANKIIHPSSREYMLKEIKGLEWTSKYEEDE